MENRNIHQRIWFALAFRQPDKQGCMNRGKGMLSGTVLKPEPPGIIKKQKTASAGIVNRY